MKYLRSSTNVFALVFLLCLVANAQDPALVWAKNMGGNELVEGWSVATDALGNVYTTGNFSGTADFDPDTGVFYLTAAGYDDIFISKLDADGNFVWAKQMGGSNFDFGRSIAIDASGNVYTVGGFQSTVDFNPGAGIYNFTSAGSTDIFISKLDPDGNFIWAKQMGGDGGDGGRSIAIDASGNVYTVGGFQSTVDFDPSGGEYNLISAGDYDIFISKFDVDGNFLWAKRMGGTEHDNGESIALDAAGNIYVTGFFTGTADFDPDTIAYNLTSAGDADIFVNKLDTDGNFLWAKRMGGISYNDLGLSIAIDASSNVYTTGCFRYIGDFDSGLDTFNLTSAGHDDIFISKLDTDGNFVWSKQMGSTNWDRGYSIAVDPVSNVYITGYFEGVADFDPGAAVFNLNAAGHNIFVVKLSQCIETIAVFSWATQGAHVQFSNTSAGATSFLWDFGDGQTSTEENPQHTYSHDSTYTVKLIVTNDCDSVSTSEQTLVIATPPVAAFSAGVTNGCTPLTVQFANASSLNEVAQFRRTLFCKEIRFGWFDFRVQSSLIRLA